MKNAIAQHLYKILREFDDLECRCNLFQRCFCNTKDWTGNHEPSFEGGGTSSITCVVLMTDAEIRKA